MKKSAKRRSMNKKETLYVGVDVHQKEPQLAVFDDGGALVKEDRLSTKELGKFLSSLPGEKRVAMEAVGFIYPIYDRLSSLEDCEVTVANPNKLRLISGSSTKNDKADARILGELLRTNYLLVAHMRDEETREKLFVIEDRVRYGPRRGELKQSIRWMLKRKGIEEAKGLFGTDGGKGLRALRLQEVDNRLDETADATHLGHITKKGDKYLRRNLLECARAAVRKDPHLRAFYTNLTRKRGEKKATIAVARKLASYAYWILKRRITYEELSPWARA